MTLLAAAAALVTCRCTVNIVQLYLFQLGFGSCHQGDGGALCRTWMSSDG